MFVINEAKPAFFSVQAAEELFGDLPREAADLLKKITAIRRFEKNSVIHSAGDIPTGFYQLLKGRIRLRLPWTPPEAEDNRLIAPNEIFGLTETIAGVPWGTSVEALSICFCEFVKREDFIYFLQTEQEIAFCLTRRLAVNFQKNYKRL